MVFKSDCAFFFAIFRFAREKLVVTVAFDRPVTPNHSVG